MRGRAAVCHKLACLALSLAFGASSVWGGSVKSWWFVVDLGKKLFVNVAFAVGENTPGSLWKLHIFLAIGACIVLHTVFVRSD